MGRNPQVQTRLPNDTYDRLTEYQEDNNISQSEATRRLIQSGLDAETDDVIGRSSMATHGLRLGTIAISAFIGAAGGGLL